MAAGRRLPLADLSVRLLPIIRPFMGRKALAGTRIMSPSLLTELGLMENLRKPVWGFDRLVFAVDLTIAVAG